jgi:CDP-paratose 2-epimerase
MIHIKDLFNIIDIQMHRINEFNGQVFNIGGGGKISASLNELTTICSEITGNTINIQSIPETRKADIRMYITDNTKINGLTHWEPVISVREILEDVYQWIRDNEQQLKPILS